MIEKSEQENRAGEKGKRKLRHSIVMTGTKLKIYGCIAMTFYTFGMSVIQNGMIHIGQYTDSEFSQLLKEDPSMMMLSGWASVMQLIGGLAVPVFAFLLVEGFLHTSSLKKYMLTILGFALLSEVPYDLAMSDSLWNVTSQNPLFALFFCLIMLYGLRLFVDKTGFSYRMVQILIVLATVLWCVILRCNFGLCTVLLVAVYYLLYDRKGVRILWGCAISSLYITGPISGYALWSYVGERGWNKNKYVFYLFYPLHLLVFGGIAHFM